MADTGQTRLKWLAAALCVAALAAAGIYFLEFRDGSGPAAPPARIVFQLPWKHSGAFAGYYMADQDGYYEQAGIDVEFREGGGPIDPIASVVEGYAQIGIASGNHLLQARAAGQPVRVISAIHQLNPIVFAVLEESGIRHPRQFAGKTIRASRTNLPILQALTMRFGVRPDSYTVVDIDDTPEVYERLYRGEIDVMTGFHFWTPNKMAKDGKSAFYMYPDDYGIHFYRDSIFTTDQFAADNPDLVERFLRASLNGWTHAAEDASHAGVTVRKYKPEADTQHATAFFSAVLPLINTGEAPIGWMRPDVWEQMHETLNGLGLLASATDPGDVFTMRFLEKIYASE
jgi:ABC-type nitrate/sulfonate/bicarbonate transport system substrate-binding protein